MPKLLIYLVIYAPKQVVRQNEFVVVNSLNYIETDIFETKIVRDT